MLGNKVSICFQLQEHPVDALVEPTSLYDTPKKIKCLLNQTCNCRTVEIHIEPEPNETHQDDNSNTENTLESHSNYVNIEPVPPRPKKRSDLTNHNNYANLDISATLDKFETSLQILRSAGFSQEDLDALEDIPENDDEVNDTAHPSLDCCNDHLNYVHMEPLEMSNSSNSNKNASDNISRISHVSDPTQNSETDNTTSTRRSSSADFTKRDDEYEFNIKVCFTPTVLRKVNKNECISYRTKSPTVFGMQDATFTTFKIPESKTENSFVARFRDSVKIRRSSSVPSKSDKNRDSSSSNDSGVSTGSLKHHRCDFSEFETPVSKCQRHSKCNRSMRRCVNPAQVPSFAKSNSSDPLKSLTFHFEEVAGLAKSNSCDVETLTRRKKKNGKTIFIDS